MLQGGFTLAPVNFKAIEGVLGALIVTSAVEFGIFATIPESREKLIGLVVLASILALCLAVLLYMWRKPYDEGRFISYQTMKKVMYIVLSTFLLLFVLVLNDNIKTSSNSSKSILLLAFALPIVISFGFILYAWWPVKNIKY